MVLLIRYALFYVIWACMIRKDLHTPLLPCSSHRSRSLKNMPRRATTSLQIAFHFATHAWKIWTSCWNIFMSNTSEERIWTVRLNSFSWPFVFPPLSITRLLLSLDVYATHGTNRIYNLVLPPKSCPSHLLAYAKGHDNRPPEHHLQ
jgi:hypothetical protein